MKLKALTNRSMHYGCGTTLIMNSYTLKEVIRIILTLQCR